MGLSSPAGGSFLPTNYGTPSYGQKGQQGGQMPDPRQQRQGRGYNPYASGEQDGGWGRRGMGGMGGYGGRAGGNMDPNQQPPMSSPNQQYADDGIAMPKPYVDPNSPLQTKAPLYGGETGGIMNPNDPNAPLGSISASDEWDGSNQTPWWGTNPRGPATGQTPPINPQAPSAPPMSSPNMMYNNSYSAPQGTQGQQYGGPRGQGQMLAQYLRNMGGGGFMGGRPGGRSGGNMGGAGMPPAPTNQQTDPINDIYQSTLGRAADAGGADYWRQQMANGMTAAQVRQQIMGGDEYRGMQGGGAGGGGVTGAAGGGIDRNDPYGIAKTAPAPGGLPQVNVGAAPPTFPGDPRYPGYQLGDGNRAMQGERAQREAQFAAMPAPFGRYPDGSPRPDPSRNYRAERQTPGNRGG